MEGEGRVPDQGILGYKKIKLTDQNSSILANPQIKYADGEEFAYIPIKSQTPLEKGYRQLNHYFDYDKWVEEMNQNGPKKKSRPDASKKRDKQSKKNLHNTS